MSRTRWLGLVLALALLLPAAAPLADETPTVSGVWKGTWRSGGGSGSLLLRLEQACDRVWGDYDADGSPAGSLRGVRVRETFKDGQLSLETATARRSLEGRLQGEMLAGTYWGTRAVKSFTASRAAPPR